MVGQLVWLGVEWDGQRCYRLGALWAYGGVARGIGLCGVTHVLWSVAETSPGVTVVEGGKVATDGQWGCRCTVEGRGVEEGWQSG